MQYRIPHLYRAVLLMLGPAVVVLDADVPSLVLDVLPPLAMLAGLAVFAALAQPYEPFTPPMSIR